jgi:hypothetical protein
MGRVEFNKGNKLKTIINYIGQMRIYSIIDILVFAKAVKCDVSEMFGLVLLWVSFLLYLESRHKDRLRLLVNQYLWVGVFLPTMVLLPWWLPLLFILAGVMYTNKKRNRFYGCTSPLWRGLQGGLMALAFMPTFTLLAFVVYTIRNLVGDFRDIGDGLKDGARTLPISLGYRRNQVWAFWGHLAMVVCTTLIWSWYAELSIVIVLLCILAEIVTYPLTPRQSNPKHLMFR